MFKTINLLILLLFISPIIAKANIVHAPHVDAELSTENQSIQPGKKIWVALRLQMENHWHTYWQNPGDSGLPTKIQWTLPAGFHAGPIQWPAPNRIDLPPLVNYGYSGELFLLTEIEVPASLPPGKGVSIDAVASWLVCREECIPGKVNLHLDLSVAANEPKPNSWVSAFAQTRARLPKKLAGTAKFSMQEGQINLQLPNKLARSDERIDFFPYENQVISLEAEPKISRTANEISLSFQRAEPFNSDFKSLNGIVVVGKEPQIRVFEIEAAPLTSISPTGFSFTALFFAFLGGIILNLMPCVFPVLGIKILSIVRQHGANHLEIRRHGIVYAIGILASFWALAVLLFLLRSAGEKLGWGFQLQSPGFVAVMGFLLFAVGLNFLGALEFGGSWMGLGSSLAEKEGDLGAFFTGVLAVVVASPCSAPFMGTAVGAAFASPPLLGLLIFTFLALGLALPYLLLSFFPNLLSFLPKPGTWMVRLKEFFAFPIFATVLWLVWVYGEQCGMVASLILISAFLLFSMAIWIFSNWRDSGIAKIIGLGILLLSFVMPFIFSGKSSEVVNSWKAYSESALLDARASHHPVFVDFTAAWCLSCQVNERLILSSTKVQDAFKQANITLLKGDWTNRDPEITRALEKLGRVGVPVYVFYSANGDEPKILPQILTKNVVLSLITNALEQEK